jgi:hypothetical protein
MAYKLQINDSKQGFNFNVRYENLSKAEKPPVVAKAPNGKEVHERTTYQGNVLGPGSTQRNWVDDTGAVYSKTELTFWYDGQQVSEIAQTKVFDIQGYQPLQNYTDNYVIDKYYELFPSDNDMKKDFDRSKAQSANAFQMRRLWEHLKSTNQVARGEFNVSSKGFVAGDGYIRAVEFQNKWGLEVGVFKEEKIFQHLQEGIPQEVKINQTAGVKLKRV